MKINYIALLLSTLLFLIGNSTHAQPVSTYNPDLCESQSLEIIDSTLTFGGPYQGVFLDNGISPTISDQYHYWTTHRDSISQKDLFLLKNHPSPIIRYYTYSYIIEKGILASKIEFVLSHLDDILRFTYRRGCVAEHRPLILHIIRHSNFSGEQMAILGNSILDKKISSQQMIDFALDHVTQKDEKYDSIRTLALQKDLGATYQLLQYKEKADEALISETIKEILTATTFYRKHSRSYEHKILEYATKYNFPNGSIEWLHDFHETAKQKEKLEKTLDRCEIVYQLIMKHNHPNRAAVMTEFLQSNFLEDTLYNRPLKRITKLLHKEHADDLIAPKMLLWEKYGVIQRGQHISDLQKAYPDKVLSLVIEEMAVLETNVFYKKSSLFKTFIEILEENNVETEKYINLALDSKNEYLIVPAMETLFDNPIPSSKARVLKYLLESPIQDRSFYPNRALHALSFYKLNNQDEKQIQEWCRLAKSEINFSIGYNPASIEELLDKMGIIVND